MVHKDESYEVDPPDWQWQGSDTDPTFSLAKAAHVCILSHTLRSLRLHFLSQLLPLTPMILSPRETPSLAYHHFILF